MNPKIASESIEAQPEGLLPWHRPEVKRLVVSLDTRFGGGSGGDATVGSDIAISDRRVKKDISRIKDALSGILALNGVNYLYNTAEYPELGLSDGQQIGFVAQELEQVYPQLVKTQANGFKAVNYAQLVPVLVEAIKQQQEMIADLQDQVKEMQPVSAVGTL